MLSIYCSISPTPIRVPYLPEELGECLGFLKQHLMKTGKEGYNFTITY